MIDGQVSFRLCCIVDLCNTLMVDSQSRCGITSFLVTIPAGKRLIPFRTQKLSPLGPMVVLRGESRYRQDL